MLTNIHNNGIKPNFTAIHIANTKNIINNVETEIKLYQMSAKHDRHFLNKFDINMETIMPNLAKYEYNRWHEMLEVAKDNALKPDRISYLAVTQDKPCGIMSFLPGKKNFWLDCICTWPVEYGKKVNLAGTTLFNQLFKVFNENKADKIKLEAITNGPFDTVSKYKNLSFQSLDYSRHKVLMETNSHRVSAKLKTLEELIEYSAIGSAEKENLERYL